MTRKVCPFCGHTYTAFRIKSKACSRPQCQKARARETRLAREAREADARQHAFEVGRKRWISRKRNMKLMEVAA
jgi:transposase-like protein